MRILRSILAGLFLLISIPAYAAVNNITEADGSPSVYPWKIKFTNGTVTDNADGTVSVAVGGSSSVTVGGPISGGTATRVLFEDGSNNLGEDADFVFATDTATITKIIGSTSITAPIFASNNADPADSGIVRLGNSELIAWEKAVAGTDWTLGVNASDVLITNAPFSVGTSNAITAGTVELGAASDTTLARSGAGVVTIEGVTIDTISGANTLTNKTLTSPTMTTPVLGTPSSGTLTNCTGLPVAGITASTSTALGVGSVELGHATDTTVARVSAGLVSVEGNNVRMFKVTSTNAPGATPTIATIPNALNIVHLTGLNAAITSMTTNLSGTPVEGDALRIDFTDNATARAITWGTSFESSTVSLPTTTVISTRLDVGFVWNTVTSKWRCVAVA